jgi:hypothetical protein
VKTRSFDLTVFSTKKVILKLNLVKSHQKCNYHKIKHFPTQEIKA